MHRRAEASLSRLYLIVGGAIVAILFAALIVPWFMDWNDYRGTFEREASRIVGHPVHIGSVVRVSILPSPSATFTNVRVENEGGTPILEIARLSTTLDLAQLLQGQVHVTAMRLDRPHATVAVATDGTLDWFKPEAGDTLDPEKVVLSEIRVNDGTVDYSDPAHNVSLSFGGINATAGATSLTGPWRIDGRYIDNGSATPFSIMTGRRLDNGSLRVRANVTPPGLGVDIIADGAVSVDAVRGPEYDGKFVVVQASAAADEPASKAPPSAWRGEGTFVLTRDRLAVNEGVLTVGPNERPFSLAGALNVAFGVKPSYTAKLESKQVDLDGALGGSAERPADVSDAAGQLFAMLAGLPAPPIPGRIDFSVPAVVVGGGLIQDAHLTATSAARGWRLEDFGARLPGDATLTAKGDVDTTRQPAFDGSVTAAVRQPVAFASWWRGRSPGGTAEALSPFDIGGRMRLSPGRLRMDDAIVHIGDATLTGGFEWSQAGTGSRSLGAQIKGDRVDFDEIKLVAGLLAGRDITGADALADRLAIHLAADEVRFEDLRMSGFEFDASYEDDVLRLIRLAVGNLAGASIKDASGRIDALTTDPHGRLDGRLEASSVDGLVDVARRFAPGSGIAEWLPRAAGDLLPAVVNVHMVAPQAPGGDGMAVTIDGVAGPTTLGGNVSLSGNAPSEWLAQPLKVQLTLDSPDTAGLARQAGLLLPPSSEPTQGHVEINATGKVGEGFDVVGKADLAGLSVDTSGRLAVGDAKQRSYSGSLKLASANLSPFLTTLGLHFPDAEAGSLAAAEGNIAIDANGGKLAWGKATVAGSATHGDLAMTRGPDQRWRVDGSVAVDEIDLGWLVGVGLGASPWPTGDTAAPWSKESFGAPGYGPVGGKVAVSAGQLRLGGPTAVADARLTATLQPQRMDIDLAEGKLAGGGASGGVSIANVEGNAHLIAQLNLTGAALGSLVWQSGGTPVASGSVDVSASIEATGRTPATLVGGMTGGGVLAVRDGVARSVNPDAVRQIVRDSDLADDIKEDALVNQLAAALDAGSFSFGGTGGAFSVAAGSIRLSGLSARAPGVQASGDVAVDLNTLHLTSNWSLMLDPGDGNVSGDTPKIGVAFQGPLAAPRRQVDAVQLSAYLNTRREARLMEILANEAAERAERDRLDRLALKLKDDRQRALRREAAARDVVHQRVAATVQAKEQADAAAAIAAARAADERARADQAQKAIPVLVAADEKAAAAAAKVKDALSTAQAAAQTAHLAMAEAVSAADAARSRAAAAQGEEDAARAALGAAVPARETAVAALAAANKDAAAKRAAVVVAEQASAAAAQVVASASTAADRVIKAREAANASLAQADSTLAQATLALSEGDANLSAAGQRVADAVSRKLQRTAAVTAANGDASAKSIARDAAKAALDQAEGDLAAAIAARDAAQEMLTRAEGIVGDGGASVREAEIGLAARKADVDKARLARQAAVASLDAAEQAANDASSHLAMLQSALAEASDQADQARADARQEDSGKQSAQGALDEKQGARDAASILAAQADDLAEAAAATLSAAQAKAKAADAALADARAAAEAAETALQGAQKEQDRAVAAVAAASKRLEDATAADAKATDEGARAKRDADRLTRAAADADATFAVVQKRYDTAAAAAARASAARAAAERDAAAAVANADAAAAAARQAAARAKAAADAADEAASEAEMLAALEQSEAATVVDPATDLSATPADSTAMPLPRPKPPEGPLPLVPAR